MTYSVHYTSALCGAGKTFGTYEYIKENLITIKRCILVQPTYENLKESQKALKQRGINSKIITNETVPMGMTVTACILNHVQNFQWNEVLLLTHEGFIRSALSIPQADKQLITVFFDETYVSSFSMISINLSTNKNIILQNLATYNTSMDNVLGLSLPPTKVLHLRTPKGSDVVNDLLRELTEKVLSHNLWDSYTLEDSFNEFKTTSNVFTAYFRVKKEVFEHFKDVYFLAAHFEDQMMNKVLRSEGLIINRKENIKLQFTKHTNTTKTNIHYMIDRNFSKGIRKVLCENNKTLMENMINVADVILDGREHLLVPNNDMNPNKKQSEKEHNGIKFTKNGKLISSYVHGLNQYQHLNDIFFLSALNYSDLMKRGIVTILGLSDEEIEKTNILSSTYQACSRISIRNRNDDSERNIIVPDRRSAMYLAEIYNIPEERIFNHSDEMYLPEPKESGRPKQENLSPAKERKLKTDSKKKIIKQINEIKDIEDEEGNKLQMNILDKLASTKVHKKLWFKEAEDIIPFFEKEAEFTSNDKATENRLLMPCLLFEENTGATTRFGGDNNEGYTCIMFDKDTSKSGRDLSFDECKEFFQKMNVSFFMYETYSGTGNFRVVLPIKHIITKEAYELITKDINHKLHKLGFDYDKDGVEGKRVNLGPFDPAGFHSSAKFFLPNHAPGTTIRTFKFENVIFDPVAYIEEPTTYISLDLAEKVRDAGSFSKEKAKELKAKTQRALEVGSTYAQKKIEEAQTKYLMSGGGNQNQASLVGTMVYFGMTDQDIIAWFNMNYNGSSTKKKVENEVKSRIQKYRNKQGF
ncbi:hypothetical protein [Acetobacter tropicalis]|nr:hypothetical protein [Acetobacter tropicalis]